MKALTTALVLALFLPAGLAHAETGDWLIRVGTHYVDPKSDNHDLVDVDGALGMTFNATYFFTSNWAVEVLAALPFSHDINGTSTLGFTGKVAETKHLPPTVSMQYHFLPGSRWRPYVGAGVNYTIFFEEDTTGPLDGSDLKLDDSIGFSAQVGIDVDVTPRLYLNAEVRYMDIDTDVKLDGNDLPMGKTVEIDPWAIGLNLGFRL